MLLYPFAGAAHGIENIRYRRLKIATLDNPNDPFEHHGFVISKAEDRRAYEGWVGHMASRYGVLCFSEGWKNPVQWSHYADRHFGLCLGYEVTDSYAIPVKYTAEGMKLEQPERMAFAAVSLGTLEPRPGGAGEVAAYAVLTRARGPRAGPGALVVDYRHPTRRATVGL